MKKQFTLDKPNVKLARQIEGAKSTINKYLKRERKKELPDGVDFWDFACKFGATAEEAQKVHVTELGKCLDTAEQNEQTSFYVEILSKKGIRGKKR